MQVWIASEMSPWVTEPLQISTGDLVPLRDQHCAKFIFQRIRVWPLRKHRICAKQFHRFRSPRHITNVGQNLIGGSAMLVASIKSPRCSKCGETMSLRIIEPERPGFDSQTFECPKCYDTKTLVAPISSAIDVSISTRPLRTSRDLCSRYRI